MGQTILVLVAILAFSIFALNQHRAQASAGLSAMGSEIELAATDLARAHLAVASALAFDEALIGFSGIQVNPGDLTPYASFGPGNDPGESPTSPPDDVDDLHGTTEAVTVVRDNRTGRETRFVVSYDVRYVLPEPPNTPLPENAPPTLAKRVTVEVVEVVEGETGRPPVRVTLGQVVTPAWRAIHG